MKRLIAWLTRPKSYGCGCGKSYRDAEAQGRCVWRHALSAD